MNDKIPFYDIANKFFVGAVFTILLSMICFDGEKLLDYYIKYGKIISDSEVILSAFLLIAMYEVGFILNRSSSVIIAPILEKTKLWPKGIYSINVSELKETNKTYNALITELVLIRSHVLLYSILAIVSLLLNRKIFFISFILIIGVLVLSGKKHNEKINKIMSDYEKRILKHEKEGSNMDEFLSYGE